MFLISPEDRDRVAQYEWVPDKLGYYRRKDNLAITLHRFIAGNAPEGFEIDHINRNPGDDRRENLRWATRRAN